MSLACQNEPIVTDGSGRDVYAENVMFFFSDLQVLIHLGNMTYELWSQSGKQGASWKRAEVYLRTLSNFQVCFF